MTETLTQPRNEHIEDTAAELSPWRQQIDALTYFGAGSLSRVIGETKESTFSALDAFKREGFEATSNND